MVQWINSDKKVITTYELDDFFEDETSISASRGYEIEKNNYWMFKFISGINCSWLL